MAGQIDFRITQPELSNALAAGYYGQEATRNKLQAQELQNQAANFEIKNALAEQESYKQAAQGGNAQQALMERGLGKQAGAYGKLMAETQKAGAEGKKLQGEVLQQRISNLAFNPSDENVVAHFQDAVKEGYISLPEAQSFVQKVLTIPQDQRAAMFTQMGAKADTLYKTQAEQQQRMQGTVPAGYRMNAGGTLEAIPGGPTTTPIAPKDLQKREAAFPQAKASVAGYESKADKFVRDIDELLENKDGLDEITGYLAGRTELSAISPSGRKALAKYNQITAKGGFQALQDIREMSKTGGALGNVSNQEGKQLVQSFAAIDRRQSADDVRAALEQVKSDIEGSKARIRETFDETYAYKQGGGAATGGAPVTGNSPAAQALARFRASKGQ